MIFSEQGFIIHILYQIFQKLFILHRIINARRDPQMLRLNFNWRFGKFDVSLFKRKNLKGEQEGVQNGMQGVGQ